MNIIKYLVKYSSKLKLTNKLFMYIRKFHIKYIKE